VAGEIQRRPRKRNVKHGLTVLLFMSPWILGFLLLILYPMLSSLYFSFTKYSCWTTRVDRAENCSFMFTKDQFFWLAFAARSGSSSGSRCGRVRIFTAWLLTLRVRGRVPIDLYFLPSMAPRRGRVENVLVFNPEYGPVNQILRWDAESAALVLQPNSSSGGCLLGCGDRRRDDHLLGGPVGRSSPLYEAEIQ
jgi:multiple sugar transport system permease protein